MRNPFHPLFAAVSALFLIASSMMPADAAARARPAVGGSLNGLWSVVITTSLGDCGIYRYPLRISNGRVVKADEDSSYQVSGSLARSGAIRVTVAGFGQTATGNGRLAQDHGNGQWRAASGQCAGQWTAERRG
jgi:hypothetical protein